jgi:2-iminobutanoate/2-iminopropanoate deaminase
MIRRIQPNAIPKPEAPYCQIVVDESYAHFSGVVAADFPDGQEVLGDAGMETHAVLNAIQRALKEINLDMSRIVRVDVHLANLDDFDGMDTAYREFFEEGIYPARTTTESRRLFGDSLVEITCMARLR